MSTYLLKRHKLDGDLVVMGITNHSLLYRLTSGTKLQPYISYWTYKYAKTCTPDTKTSFFCVLSYIVCVS